jgi:hypothetical protein
MPAAFLFRCNIFDAERRILTFQSEEKDLIIIGGGVAGYVAAIKAGQEGMKVSSAGTFTLICRPAYYVKCAY